MTIEEYEKEQKLAELEDNFNAVKDTYTTAGGKTYNIDQEHLTDLIGLVTLSQGSDLAVTENDVTTLVPHTAQQVADLLEEIRVYLTGIKTTRFNKRDQLNALNDYESIVNFDVTI